MQSHGDETSDHEDDMRGDCESSDEGVNVNSHINGNPITTLGMNYPRSPPSHINPETHLRYNRLG